MEFGSALQVATVGLAILLTVGLLFVWRKLPVETTEETPVRVLGMTSPILTWLKSRHVSLPKVSVTWFKAETWSLPKLKLAWAKLWTETLPTRMASIKLLFNRTRFLSGLLTLVEVSLIIAWAGWVGREYLNANLNMWPAGGEFAMGIQNTYNWRKLAECGVCFFWDGFSNGGMPAFVDVHGGWLHPLSALATWGWGEINGGKVTVIAALAMAGLAQWYLGKVLGVGVVPRLWSAGIAVAGGHLGGRMMMGLVPLVLSTSACSLVIPFALDLALRKHRRTAIGLGLALGLALLAGQGYLQLGLILSLSPALLVVLTDDQFRLDPVWRYFIFAGLLALLVAAVLVVPFLHFSPNWAKDGDANFASALPLAFGPLTLVINDMRFYNEEIFRGGIYSHLNYIGWVPVLLALVALALAPHTQRRLLLFFVIAIGVAFSAAAALPFKLLAQVWAEAGTAVRNPAPIAGLAVPFVLGLAAWGLDRLLKLNWPTLVLVPSQVLKSGSLLSFSLAWLLAWPLTGSLQSASAFSSQWLYLLLLPPPMPAVVQHLVTPTAQWVQPPWGEHGWFPYTMNINAKVAYMFRPWTWKDREYPPVFIEGTRQAVDTASPNYLGVEDGILFVRHPENEYALVETAAGQVPCLAQARGGDIDVTCNTEIEGKLVVREHFWSGWGVSRDGMAASLNNEAWLSTSAPAGVHRYAFRYRPWDVPLGLVLSLTGWLLALVLWRRWPDRAPEPTPAAGLP